MTSRRVGVLFLSLLFVSASLTPSLYASSPDTTKRTLTGTLVDITCATDPKTDLGKLRAHHTRKCLLMPICAASGYAVLTDDDEVLRFDTKGNHLAQQLIEKHARNQHWRVSIDGSIDGDQLDVVHIKLLRSK